MNYKNMIKEEIKNSKQLIIYGSGECGKFTLNALNVNQIVCFCDSNKDKQHTKLKGLDILSLEEASKLYSGAVVIVAITRKTQKNDMVKAAEKYFKEDNIYCFGDIWNKKFYSVDVQREFCKTFHLDGMQPYYENAESKSWVDVFWSENSEFYKMFKKLDLTNIIELACGHGRHVLHYIDKAENITLVDILPENIDFCKNRFAESNKLNFYVNNGYDFHNLPDNTYTALFTYDAMVHFEMIDIYHYLMDTYRVLKHGSYALFHHSNNHDYKASFANSTYAYMTQDLFQHLAFKAGFDVVEQYCIDISDCPSLNNAITLLIKK